MASYNDLLGVNQNLRCDELTIGRSSKIPKINGIGGKVGSLIIEGNLNLPDIAVLAKPDVVAIDNLTGALSRMPAGGGGSGGDVFLDGFAATKKNTYTDDTINEFKGEIVFGTGTAGEPKTATDMDANDRILSVDINGKLVTNNKIPDSSIDFTSGQFMELAGSNTVTATNTFTGVNNFGPQAGGLKVGTAVALYDNLTPANEGLIRFQDALRNNIPAGLSLYGGTGLTRPILFHLTGDQVNDACFEMSRNNDETRFIIESKEINDVAILDLQVSNDFLSGADHCVIKFTSTNAGNPSNICTLKYLPDSQSSTAGTLKTDRIFQALKTISIANSTGSQIELQHIDAVTDIPIPHFKITNANASQTQMALSSDLTMIRNGSNLVDSPLEPVATRGKVPDKAMGFSSFSGEITYVDISGGGSGDALLAGANVFTAVNTFDVSVDTKLLKLSNTIPFVGTTEYVELDYEIAAVGTETNLRSDRNVVIRNKTESSGIGSTLTIDSLDADWANPASIPRSTLQFRVTNPANLNNNNTGVIDFYGYAAGNADRKFTVSDTMEVNGNIKAYDGTLIFGSSNSPITITQTETTVGWTDLILNTADGFNGKVSDPPEFPQYMITTTTKYVNGQPNEEYKRVDFRGVIICDNGISSTQTNKPFLFAINGLPDLIRRHIVKIQYFVPTAQSPITNSSNGATVPHGMFYRGSVAAGYYCQAFNNGAIIGLTSSNTQQYDLGYNVAKVELYIDNTFYYSN
jgi:hypothetical protein